MKLLFKKVAGNIQVELEQSGVVSEFTYPAFIGHLYAERELENPVFADDDITQEEQQSILQMITEIKGAVLSPSIITENIEDSQQGEDEIPF